MKSQQLIAHFLGYSSSFAAVGRHDAAASFFLL
jgi:hypothetical protein